MGRERLNFARPHCDRVQKFIRLVISVLLGEEAAAYDSFPPPKGADPRSVESQLCHTPAVLSHWELRARTGPLPAGTIRAHGFLVTSTHKVVDNLFEFRIESTSLHSNKYLRLLMYKYVQLICHLSKYIRDCKETSYWYSIYCYVPHFFVYWDI